MKRLAPKRLALAVCLAAIAPAAAAQHPFAPAGDYDAAVPTPRAVLGHELGERFTPHHLIVRYAERVAAASPRVRVDTVARSFEGRELLLVTITSEANRARLAEIERGAARLAAGGADAEEGARTLPAIAWLGYTVHGNEASGTEAALALVYQLAAGRDAATRAILDSVVVLIDPVQNPDGHERHVQDVMRARGARGPSPHPAAMVHQGAWPGGRTSHYYFDLNRDWFILSHPESRGRVATFMRWWPHVAVDLHEMGSGSTYFFAPPMQPVNANVHPLTHKWWDLFAAGIGSAFDAQGWSYFRREGYDEFYPGYGVSWPILNGAVGATFEQASSAGGAIRRADGTVMTLREAASHHYTAAWATLETLARHRAERLRDYLETRRAAMRASAADRAVVIERDAQGRADSLVRLLARNGIAVQRLRAAAESREARAHGGGAGARWEAGAYVVDLAQPQGRLARALLEPDARLDSAFIREELEARRTGRADRFYDVTAWSLPYAWRLRAWTARALPAGLEPVDTTALAAPAAEPPAGRYGYAFEAGSEASYRLLGTLLADSVRVWYAPRAFRAGEARFPRGAFVVRAAANDDSVHAIVRRAAREAGARVAPLASAMVDEGTDLGSNSVFFVRPPRVAMLGGAPVQGNSFGFAWFAFDQRLGYPVTAITTDAVTGGALSSFDVLVVPSASAPGLDRALGDAGRERLAGWVRDGGVLVTLDGATAWLAGERTGLARLRLRRDSARADGEGGAPLPVSVPGAIVRAAADTLSPLLAGVHDVELPVLVNSDRAYVAPRDLRPGEAVVRHAPAQRLRLAGYLWPEAPARLADSPWLWTERVGRGRVIAFAGDPNFRDLWRGHLPLFANAVFLGASY